MKKDYLSVEGENVILWAAVSSKAQDRYSVDDQLRFEREWCLKHNANIVDELIVRGFSRDYWTLADVVQAASDDLDMAAFARLQEHIRRRDFTLFLCFDADRFGRTTSLVHEVLGRVTRDCQARVLTLFDNTLIDSDNASMIGTIKAFKAQQDIDKFKEYHETGFDNRARDGKSVSPGIPLFLKRVRDDKGKEIGLAVNEDLRPLWTDLATLLLRGVSWNSIEAVLFSEFGHGRNGKAYRAGYMHDLVLHHQFWGHSAVNYRFKGDRSVQGIEPWIWDETVPAPPPITIYHNRIPAVYSGEWAELGEEVKAELWRRYKLRGKATPEFTFRYHGLLVCDECGYTLTKAKHRDGYNAYMRCSTKYDTRYRARGIVCEQRGVISGEDIQAYFNAQLQRELEGDNSDLFDATRNTDVISRRIALEQKALQRLTDKGDALISELTEAPEKMRPAFRRQIEITSEEIERVKANLHALQREATVTDQTLARRQYHIAKLRENGGLRWLWEQPDQVIHQFLAGALGNNQLVVRDRQITGVIPMQNQTLLKRRRKNRIAL